jgi:tetratricopeptide (TPR) repeat protein
MHTPTIFLRLVALAAVTLLLPACSIKRMAINSMADTLASSGSVFASDDDPELIRDAVPFSLKTIESLLESVPDHPGLLLSACSGFTQYAYAFIQLDADMIELEDYRAAARGRDRALKMYLRARDYCFRRFELTHRGIRKGLAAADPAPALAAVKASEVPVLYWTAASWGSAVSLGLDRPELVGDFPAVRALVDRALALDERWSSGALHELGIVLDSVPEAMRGSPERARKHFARAVELQHGASAGPYVSLAANVSLPAQDRAEFRMLLEQALAIDPDKEKPLRLANLLAQRKARYLLDHIDDLFGPEPDDRWCQSQQAGFFNFMQEDPVP